MIWALLLEAALAISVVVSGVVVSRRYLRQVERERHAWVSERSELLNRIMYLAERPWVMPEPVEAPPVEDWDRPVLVWPEGEPEE